MTNTTRFVSPRLLGEEIGTTHPIDNHPEWNVFVVVLVVVLFVNDDEYYDDEKVESTKGYLPTRAPG